MRVMTDAGKAFIKKRESCILTPHWDAVGEVWDIGYGHVLKNGEAHEPITQDEAEALFDLDIHYYSDTVDTEVLVPTSDGQFDALCSLTYSMGTSPFKTISLLRVLNAGLYADAGLQFLRWNKSRGSFVNGLLNRRAREQLMYAYGEYLI